MKKYRGDGMDEEHINRELRREFSSLVRIKAPGRVIDSVYHRIREEEGKAKPGETRMLTPRRIRWQVSAAVLMTLVVSIPLTILLTRNFTETAVQKTYIVRFIYENETAETVHIMGDFNNWHREGFRMQRIEDTPYWTAELELTEGIYKYAFLIDNEVWTVDPLSMLRVKDNFGNENSLIVLFDDTEERTRL